MGSCFRKTGRRKAISPIISIIILLLIVIAIAGAGYSYISVYWTTITGQNIALKDAFPTAGEANLVVRNEGTKNITLADVKIINSSTGEEITGTWATTEGQDMTQLEPGKFAKFTTSCIGYCSYRLVYGTISSPAVAVDVGPGPSEPQCGDYVCEGDETCETCEADCGVCSTVCGDGTCEGDETCETCETDCGVCPQVCGDGAMEGDEECDDGAGNTDSPDLDCYGQLTYCNTSCSEITANCNRFCGNGNIDSGDGEVCDGASLGAETCQTQGYDSGDLACSGDCMSFDTSDCVSGEVIGLTGCTNIIASGTYYLENDITDSSSSYCMNISANNVILDCQGNMIDGDDSADYGIYVYRDSEEDTNITIRDCAVSDWDALGIYLYRAGSNSLINVNVTSNMDRGIRIYRSSNNDFTNCNVSDNGDEGIYISNSNYNTFTDCSINNNRQEGIIIRSADYNTFTGCKINYNGREGVYLRDSDYNTFTDCSVNNNRYEGIELRSDYNTFTGCKINNNAREGVYVISADYNTFTDCIVNNNGEEGMSITSGSSGNKIINTRLLNNSYIDYWDMNSYCDSELVNVTGTDNKPIVYYNETVIIRDWDVSEIILCNADNSVIDNVTLNRIDRQNNAILLINTDNTIMTDVDVINSRYGIYLRRSQNNIISDCYAGDNIYGIYIYHGEGNNITGCNVTNNNVGVYLSDTGTLNNIITNSYFTDNSYDLVIQGASNNIIYNNLFNSTDNIHFYTPIYDNTWNTTLASGTNIIGGSYLGGNYWANLGGTGFSETCADSGGDGICDLAYNAVTDTGCTPGVDCGDNADYLPLK